MKKFYIYFIFIILFKATAQQDLRYPEQFFGKSIATSFKATPDVHAFQVRSINSVNNYTGAIDLEIPIFEIDMDGLKIPISIQYNSKGVKVDDISSSVGMNWNLNAGGNIVRVIKDVPDHKVGWYCLAENDWDLGVYLTPQVGSIGSIRRKSHFFQNYLAWGPNDRFAIYSENDNLNNSQDITGRHFTKKDSNYDEYHVNVPSLNDVFILKNSSLSDDPFVPGYNNSNLQAYFRDNLGNKLRTVVPKNIASIGNGFASDLEYEHPYISTITHYGMNSRNIKDFFDFELLNDEGFIYTFSDYDVVENFYGASFQENSFFPTYTRTVLSNGYNKDVASWHINKIESPYGVKSVQFEYENYNHSTVEKKRQLVSRTKLIDNTFNSQINFLHEETDSYGGVQNFNSGRNWEKIPRQNRLKKILFPEGRVEFIYVRSRLDYTGGSRLSEIKIYNLQGNLVKHVELNQVYFNTKDGTVGPLNHRMFLESVIVNNLSNVSQPEVYKFEYNDPDRLPKRYSNEQDFLGYFNNNGNTSNEGKTPKLYYYPDLELPKFLPFQLPTQFNRTVVVNGDYSLESHVNSLYGLLNKITYPTKGYTTYEYQHDIFKVSNVAVEAGSARIRSQKIYDSNAQLINEVEYEYPNNEGYINSFPLLALLSRYNHTPLRIKSVMTHNMPKSGIELTQGSFVGYAKVREKYLKSNLLKEYDFTTPLDYPLVKNEVEFKSNIQTPSTISIMNEILKNKIPYYFNDLKNGKLKEIRTYDGGVLKNKTTNIYKNFKSNVHSILTENYFQSLDIDSYYFDYKSKSSFNQEFLGIDKILVTEYEGNQNNTFEKNYTYKTSNSFLSPRYYPFVSSEILKTANGESKTEYSYPFGNLIIGTSPYPTELSTSNRLSTPYATIYKTNDKIIKKQILLYDSFSYNNGNTMSFPRANVSTIQENFMNTVNTDEIIIDYRDECGNIATYRKPDNTYITTIWGYKGTYPIVQIKNMKYQDLNLNKVNNIRNISDTATGNVEALINAILDLKSSLPSDVFLEYSIYKPLVGIIVAGDANGKKTYYSYDGLNRLTKIYDNDSNIIKEYGYSYE